MKASQTSVCITPPLAKELDLAGFSVRGNSSLLLGDQSLYVSVTWLKDDCLESVVIISIDTLYVDTKLANEVYGYLGEKFNVNFSNIIFNASHTHSAPSICSDIFGVEDNLHKERVAQAIKEAIDAAFQKLTEKPIQYFKFPLPNNLVVNRRLFARDIKTFFLKKKMIMAPNYDAYIDDNCRAIILGGSSGVLFNISCHPVFNISNNISSDFPGGIRRVLNSYFNVSAFVQGFCGDIRPNSISKGIEFDSPVLFLKTLINKFSFKPATKEYYDSFCKKIGEGIIQHSLSAQKLKGSVRAKSFFAGISSDTSLCKREIICKLVLIDKVLLLSIPAEVNSKYLELIERKFPELFVLPMGYAENVIGYLPHWSETNEGGYEVESYSNYGWDEKISLNSLKELEYKILIEIKELQKGE